MLRRLLGNWMGTLGLGMLILMVITSAAVLLTFPSDFGRTVWNSPAYWADNPKSSPPFWVGLRDKTKARHQVFSGAIPEVLKEDSQRIYLYRFRAELSPGTMPSFLSFSLSDVLFWNAPPTVEVYLEDGKESSPVYRLIVPGRRPDETGAVVRYRDEPFRIRLDTDFSSKDQIQAFYKTLRQIRATSFTAVVRVAVADERDRVAGVKFVSGGQAFGWLGTDNIGRDLAKGILYGLPLALLVAVSVAFLTTIIGAVIGGVSGYFGGWVDSLIQSSLYVIINIPKLPVIIMLVYAYGSKLSYVILFLIVFGWMGLVITLRPLISQLRESGFITYAKASGFSSSRIILRHILPQTTPLLLANFVIAAPGAILTEAGLSLLGLGDPSFPSWGSLLNQGFRTGALTLGYWWWVLPPILAIILTILAFHFISEALKSETTLGLQSEAGKEVENAACPATA